MRISSLIITFGSFLILVQARVIPTPDTTCASCTPPCMDVVFVLDVSDSLKENHFNVTMEFVRGVVNDMNISSECSHAAVILFKANVQIKFNVNEYTNRDSLIQAIKDIDYDAVHGKGTNTPEVLRILRTEGEKNGRLKLRDDYPHIAVMITDGNPRLGQNFSDYGFTKVKPEVMKNMTKAEAELLHDTDIYDQIYAVGVGNKIKNDILEAIADPMEMTYHHTAFTDKFFNQLRCDLAKQLSNPCLMQSCGPGTKCTTCEAPCECFCMQSCAYNNGGCDENQICREAPNPDCEPGQCCSPVNVTCSVVTDCGPKTDIVFVIDISKSIGQGYQDTADLNFRQVKQFITNMVNIFKIGTNDDLVGVVEFARWANITFSVSDNTNKQDLLDAVDNLTYGDINNITHETTNTPYALDLLRNESREGGKLGLRYDSTIHHMLIFITDGRANTKLLTNNTRQEDAVNTDNAARLLHHSDVYDVIFAVGIGGENKDVNRTQLEVIASDPNHVFMLDDFTSTYFDELQQDLTRLICICEPTTGQTCRAENQVYTLNAPDCNPTCNNPNPPCLGTFREGCTCPNGTILDEIQNRCVPLSECKCPPQCTHEFCTSQLVRDSRKPVPCMRGPPTSNITECMDPCKLTYCNACYYNESTMPTPQGCDNTCEDRLYLACVQEWATCTEKINVRDNKCKGGCETAENFKCYDYYGC